MNRTNLIYINDFKQFGDDNYILFNTKVCSCGDRYIAIPKEETKLQYSDASYIYGIVYTCNCKSTMMIPKNNISNFD